MRKLVCSIIVAIGVLGAMAVPALAAQKLLPTARLTAAGHFNLIQVGTVGGDANTGGCDLVPRGKGAFELYVQYGKGRNTVHLGLVLLSANGALHNTSISRAIGLVAGGGYVDVGPYHGLDWSIDPRDKIKGSGTISVSANHYKGSFSGTFGGERLSSDGLPTPHGSSLKVRGSWDCPVQNQAQGK